MGFYNIAAIEDSATGYFFRTVLYQLFVIGVFAFWRVACRSISDDESGNA